MTVLPRAVRAARRRGVVLLAVPVLLLAACGGDEPLPGGDAASASTEADEGAATTVPATPSTTPGGAPGAGPAAGSAPAAVAELLDPAGNGVGLVTFTPVESNDRATDVAIEMIDDGITENAFHGMHIHANDVPGNGEGCLADPDDDAPEWFLSADDHLGADAGTPHGEHIGDLPNLYVGAGGVASARFTTERFVVDDVIGAAVVVHADPDNFGNVPRTGGPRSYAPNSDAAPAQTEADGNSGARVSCGVIQVGSGGAGNPAR